MKYRSICYMQIIFVFLLLWVSGKKERKAIQQVERRNFPMQMEKTNNFLSPPRDLFP